jgi:hypothetical protein
MMFYNLLAGALLRVINNNRKYRLRLIALSVLKISGSVLRQELGEEIGGKENVIAHPVTSQ